MLSGMRREVKIEDVAELIQHIQSRLPVKEAARTSVLSKSWLHAWSTIPTLKCRVRKKQSKKKSMKLVDVDRTLIRYLRDNIPIERFDLRIDDIENQESASHAEKWIGPVAAKTCLKEFSLSIFLPRGVSFTLPDDIFSGENLTKIRVSFPPMHGRIDPVWTPSTVIKCVSLRELRLDGVRISEEALHQILSSCSLLVKIQLLRSCEGFKTIKVKNLHFLYELSICISLEVILGLGLGYAHSPTALEISDVPNLGVFSYKLDLGVRSDPGRDPPLPFNSHSISLGSSVTQLTLGAGMITGNAYLAMIESGFPFLESLTFDDMTYWMSESFHFTCASIKRLSLRSCRSTLVDVQVHAPTLLFFSLDVDEFPGTLLLPVSTLDQITLSLELNHPRDASFFLNLREALTLARECYLHMIVGYYKPPMHIDIDDLRSRLKFPPAMNVQQLRFQTTHEEHLWKRSPFFDAFFEICHPKHVYAMPDELYRRNNHFCRLILREVLNKTTTTLYWPHHLKQVQIRQTRHQTWETLTSSHTRFLDGSALDVFCMLFKLMWG